MDLDTIKQHLKKPELAAAWDQGVGEGKVSLRRLQWRHALREDSGGVSMTIHLSKHHLGERDRILFDFSEAIKHFEELTDTQFDEVIRIQKQALAAIQARSINGLDRDDGGDPEATRH